MNINDWLEGNRKRQLDTFLASFRENKTPPNKAARISKSTKEKSWTRIRYEKCFRMMRRGYEFEFIGTGTGLAWEITKAADYSYQARDYDVHGWTSTRRKIVFHKIVWRILTQREELPF